MTDINSLVLEGYIEEKSFRDRMVRSTAAASRNRAIGGKIRSLSKDSPSRARIKMLRAQLKVLVDRERQQYGGRAKSQAMSGR